MKVDTFQDKILKLIKKIPKGKVTTYKEIGEKLNSKAYRAIGQALKANKTPIIIPCHRVVNSDGSLGGYCGKMNSRKKILLLKKEKVFIKNGKIIDFKNKLFTFQTIL